MTGVGEGCSGAATTCGDTECGNWVGEPSTSGIDLGGTCAPVLGVDEGSADAVGLPEGSIGKVAVGEDSPTALGVWLGGAAGVGCGVVGGTTERTVRLSSTLMPLCQVPV
jgi:hypothetical protein